MWKGETFIWRRRQKNVPERVRAKVNSFDTAANGELTFDNSRKYNELRLIELTLWNDYMVQFVTVLTGRSVS